MTDTEIEETKDDDELFELMDISVDVAARDRGVLIEKNKIAPGLKLIAKGYDSPAIQALQIALRKERPDQYGEDDEITVERNRYENRKQCEAGIIGWEPFAWKGERIEYSPEVKKKLLKDKHFQKFILACMDAMNQADNVRIKWERDAEKNSADGSENASAATAA